MVSLLVSFDAMFVKVCVTFHTTTGLPATGSWQDLKDHMREAGDVCYADVYKDGTGVVEFLRYEDMKYAARKLDDSKFRSHEVSMSASVMLLFCLTSALSCYVAVSLRPNQLEALFFLRNEAFNWL